MSKGNRIFRINREIKRVLARGHEQLRVWGPTWVPNEHEGKKLPVKLSHRRKEKHDGT